MYRATIIIPLLNQVDAYLDQAVRSAIGQTVLCEVLVVTSSRTRQSNLDTLAGLQQSSPNLKVVQQDTGGFPAALNFGIRLASTERIGFLLSDDWLDAAAVAECLKCSTDIVSTQKMTYAADGKTPIHRPWHSLTMKIYDSKPELEAKASYLGHFFLFQRRKLDEVGGLDETLGDTPGIDDFDLVWTLLEHRASVMIVEKPLYNYRDHPGERLTLRDPEEMKATMRQILAKHNLSGRRAREVLARHARSFGRLVADVAKERLSSSNG